MERENEKPALPKYLSEDQIISLDNILQNYTVSEDINEYASSKQYALFLNDKCPKNHILNVYSTTLNTFIAHFTLTHKNPLQQSTTNRDE